MINYSPPLPRGKDGDQKQNYVPPKVAVAATNNENAAVSSILVLTHNTTEVEIAVIGAASFVGIAAKWISQANLSASVAATSVITAAGTANFDFVVAGGTVRRFVVPISTNPQTAGSIQGVNREYGLFPAIAYKTLVGNSSVLTSEF